MINELRKKIDKIDIKISKQLSKRYEIVTKIAQIKQNNKLPVYNKAREEEHIKDILKKSGKDKNFKNYLSKVFQEIFRISREVQ